VILEIGPRLDGNSANWNVTERPCGNHAYIVAFHKMYYYIVRIHSTLCVTPAMAAGVSDRLWEVSDIVNLGEDAEGDPGERGPYKKKNSTEIKIA